GYLTPTGSKVYEPAFVKIGQPVDAHVEQGRIVRFEGQARDVAAIKAHYQSVSKQFSIDPMVVHSWHAGIHPGCTFDSRIQDDPDLWSNSIFQNPRYLHFHTCGAYPPGEICWMIQDPTILLDGTPLWKDGVLQVQSFPSLEMCLGQWPPLEALFAHPGTAVGR
ncbi:MAG: hypothetical protein P1V34_06710, partial [Alphaproteobacteria bacterium]|nr:hypothetical protein [Alphaproteobacteria bacterium]